MILVAADRPFWGHECPRAARAAMLIRALQDHGGDCALYLGDALEDDERDRFVERFPGLALHELPWAIKNRRMRRNRFRSIARRLGAKPPPGPVMREQCEDFERLCQRLRPRAIVCLAPCLSGLVQPIPAPRPRTWVDCFSARVLQRAENAAGVAEATLERDWLDHFDSLIAAAGSDAIALAGMFPGKEVVTVEEDAAALVEALGIR